MSSVQVLVFLLIAANVLISVRGFRDEAFYERHVFEVDAIRLYKQYYRLLTSSFLHADWIHLIFNMFALFSFSSIGAVLGPVYFLVIYFGSMLAGDLLALYIRRHDGGYRAVGASGAILGIIFASVAFFPDHKIWALFIPMPAWLFGILFILASIYGIRNRHVNIGFEAHLGGAIAGILLSVLIEPALIQVNGWYLLLLLLPFSVFLYILVRRPELLMIDQPFRYESRRIKERFSRPQEDPREELNRLLEKVNAVGYDRLSDSEKRRLDELSRKL